jgi:menaquinone-9 beta-reductase
MSYDLLVIGGGIAGATLAGVMAREGAKVLVAERTSTFSDRVRGEALIPWGVEEARRRPSEVRRFGAPVRISMRWIKVAIA